MTKKPVDLSYALNLKPEDALKYFEGKGYVLPKKLSEGWQEVYQEAHAKAFTVARVTQMDVLEDIRGMVQKSLDEGITFNQFKKELMPKLVSRGWWGITQDENGKDVQLGSVRRLKTIYDTNLRTSYMAGRYKAMAENTDNRPYWMYDAKNDSKTRPTHRALDSTVRRYDDPFWDNFYPPNGWHCRCNVIALNEDNLKEKGLTANNSNDNLLKETKLLNDEEKQVTVFTTKNAAGNNIKVSTDVGWDYNVGKSAFQPDLEKYDYKVAKQYVQGTVTSKPFENFYLNTSQKVSSLIETNSNKEALDIIKKDTTANKPFPVAVINDEYKKILDTEYQTVKMSEYTLSKQFIEHPELKLADYHKLPDIIEKAEVITQEGKNKLVFMKDNDKYDLAIIKDTQDGLYIVTYYKTGLRELNRRLKNGKVLKNILEQ